MHYYLALFFCLIFSGCSPYRQLNLTDIGLSDPSTNSVEILDPMAPELLITEDIVPKVQNNIGNCISNAILITGIRSRFNKITAQIDFLSSRYGKFNLDWSVKSNRYLRIQTKHFDVFDIVTTTNLTNKSIFFDSTDFYNNL